MQRSSYRWIEHDPEEIWQGVQQCVHNALQTAEKASGSIKVKAVGITNQRETTLVWDKTTGKPLYNAIVWMDNRTESICKQIEDEHSSKASIYNISAKIVAMWSCYVHLILEPFQCISQLLPMRFAACHRTTSGLSPACPSVHTSPRTR